METLCLVRPDYSRMQLQRFTGSTELTSATDGERAPKDLLTELTLRLVCFYADGSVHLWYAGTAMFNHLDVDLGLDSNLRLTDVRFDA